MINSISAANSLLAVAVKPVAAPVTVDSPALPPSGPVSKGPINSFALSVLADVLESEQTLLDGKDHNRQAETAANIGAVADNAQQASNAYKAASALRVAADIAPIKSIIV